METAERDQSYPELPILVLDDDETLRTRIEILFARAGLDNVVAIDDEAKARALVAGGKVSLVLLDLFLPEERGESLLKDFSSAAPEVPVIVLTSTAETATVVRCMRAGSVDYLVKPIDETRLFVSVWNALATVELGPRLGISATAFSPAGSSGPRPSRASSLGTIACWPSSSTSSPWRARARAS